MQKDTQQQGRNSPSDQILTRDFLETIEEQRKSYELPHHWQLRKEFLLLYAAQFDIDRLICLSNLFVNITCLGLEYPDEVMKLVYELGSKVKALETYKYQTQDDLSEPSDDHADEEFAILSRKKNNNKRKRY